MMFSHQKCKTIEKQLSTMLDSSHKASEIMTERWQKLSVEQNKSIEACSSLIESCVNEVLRLRKAVDELLKENEDLKVAIKEWEKYSKQMEE